jgi:copper chaperone NosL
MTIVDAQHGAEAVTSKGKVYRFDAIECLANFTEQQQNKSFAFLLVNDYHSPKELIDAKTSHYLISKKLPSPMGAYLTAFREKSAALEMQKAKGGEVFDWDEVRGYLKENGIVKTVGNR